MRFGILVLAWATCTCGFAQNATQFVLGSNARIDIYGSSNVAEFRCGTSQVVLKSPLWAYKTPRKLEFSDQEMRVPVKELSCGNYWMNKDVCATLRADEFPEISFELIQLVYQRPSKQKQDGWCSVRVVLAGVERTVKAPFRYDLTEYEFILRGTLPIKFSDFKLVAPQKMGGTVIVRDELLVHFELPFVPTGT